MADALSPEQKATYSPIIDDILAHSDLETISAKRIRKGLQDRVDHDIAAHKDAITELIMSRFDKINNQKGDEGGPAVPAPPTTNGTTPYHPAPKPPASPSKRKADADTDRDLTPPPKKAKKAPPIETDEQLAKRMQAELNAPSARSTRGGGTTAAKKKGQTIKGRKDVTPSKSRKKKSKAKIRSEDDSEVNSSGSDGEDNKPVRARTGGFHKLYTLSEPLAILVGAPQLSRPQTVKKIWEHVKERDLQDPSDKRQIRCDDPMRAVFRQERVHMFTMNKLLAGHLWAADE